MALMGFFGKGSSFPNGVMLGVHGKFQGCIHEKRVFFLVARSEKKTC